MPPPNHTCPPLGVAFAPKLACGTGRHADCDGILHLPAGCYPCNCQTCQHVGDLEPMIIDVETFYRKLS